MAVNYDQNRQPPEHTGSDQGYDTGSSAKTRRVFERA